MEMKRKENIIQTLKVIILIVLLMAVVLIIYFGMEIIEEKYPNAMNNMVNNLNKNNNGIFY
jgi:preprotein translocase subunit YajC